MLPAAPLMLPIAVSIFFISIIDILRLFDIFDIFTRRRSPAFARLIGHSLRRLHFDHGPFDFLPSPSFERMPPQPDFIRYQPRFQIPRCLPGAHVFARITPAAMIIFR